MPACPVLTEHQPCLIRLRASYALHTDDASHLQLAVQVMSLWIWLSHRFGAEAFPGLEAVAAKSEAVIDLMNKGLERMCEMNKRPVRQRSRTDAMPMRANGQAQLLLKHDPLAVAYLADANNHKYINSYEWRGPDVVQAVDVLRGAPWPSRRLQAAA